MKNAAALVWLGLVFAGVVGWFMNIVKVFGLWSSDITTELIIRLVGIPIPFIGAIAGYF